IFKGADFDVLDAADGEAGLKVALTKHPDIILLDLLMPKMDGLDFLKLLRQDGWGLTTPVILLTNLELNDERLARVIQYKAAYYFTKGEWSLKEIVQKVHELVRRDA
ncbi:response regulator, partial [Candidatus Uhrbacteria bacterium]|nr:response regulator [Candidatus Uhrbacteria bacterium]